MFRGWSGNITEKVTFKIHGHQPDSYTDYHNGMLRKHCIITEFEKGKNYVWEWVNERLLDFYVGVVYSNNNLGPLSLGAKIGISVSVIIVSLISGFIVLYLKKKGKENKKSNL